MPRSCPALPSLWNGMGIHGSRPTPLVTHRSRTVLSFRASMTVSCSFPASGTGRSPGRSPCTAMIPFRRKRKPPWTFPSLQRNMVEEDTPAPADLCATGRHFWKKLTGVDRTAGYWHPVFNRTPPLVPMTPSIGSDDTPVLLKTSGIPQRSST